GVQPDATPRGGGDPRGATPLHGPDRAPPGLRRRQPQCGETVRQRGLVDDADGRAVRLEPDRAHGLAIDIHGGTLNALCAAAKALSLPPRHTPNLPRIRRWGPAIAAPSGPETPRALRLRAD